MANEFRPNPFEISEAEKAANLARVKAERDRRDIEERGFEPDGIVVEAISDFGLRAMDKTEKGIEAFKRARDYLGVLAVSGPSIYRERMQGK